MARRKRFQSTLSLLLVAVTVLLPLNHPRPVSAQSAPSVYFEDRAGGMRNHITVWLQTDSAPGPGGIATITLRAEPAVAVESLQLEWLLPEGVEWLGGPLTESTGPVAHGRSADRMAQIRFPAPGVYKVMGSGGYSMGGESWFSALGVLYFNVTDDGFSTVSDQDPNATASMQRAMPMSVEEDVNAAAVRSPDGDPCFNISGVVMRTERAPAQRMAPIVGGGTAPFPNYANPVLVPVRYAHVEMREEDTLFDDSYGHAFTDEQGRFNFKFCDDDGFLDDELELYVRLYAEIDFGGHDVVTVSDDGLIGDLGFGDSVWTFDGVNALDESVLESEGGTYNLTITLDEFQSEVMNIADAIFDAWDVWNLSGGAKGDDAVFDGEAEVHYRRGDGEEGSYYNGYFLVGSNLFNNNDITIADDPSNPDPWDDSVIIHEWGHMADDFYGCDDNGGGEHFIDRPVDDLELSWGEGYPNYWQSVVRDVRGRPSSSWYLDVDGSGNNGIAVNLETYDLTRTTPGAPNPTTATTPRLLSDFNELAIAALLWDLYDNNDDPRAGMVDRVAYGHAPVQEVYTDPFFESNGDWADDTCTAFVYLWSWIKLGKPADGATAQVVRKNLGHAAPITFGGRAAVHAAGASDVQTASNPNDIDIRWWQRLTMLADNSASMAAAGKFDAVKTVMQETVNDLVAPAPKGVEVQVSTFNNTGAGNQTALDGLFFADVINPEIDRLATVAAADPTCQVNGLRAIQEEALTQSRAQLWLYTDGDSVQSPSVPALTQQLNGRQMRASIALLGGCAPLARKNSDVTGAEEEYLRLAADGSQSSGIVPYMLTALGTGGQFLYVSPDQLGDAADVLRAGLAGSAGAGRWSDYVSDSFTYRWDRLTSREYDWFPAESLGTELGQLPDATAVYVIDTLPNPVPYYNGTVTSVGVSQDGFMELDPCLDFDCALLRLSRNFLDVLHTDLVWDYQARGPRAAANEAQTPDQVDETACQRLWAGQRPDGFQACVFTANLGFEWHIISVQGLDSDRVYRAYQIWLNEKSGEIRYLYDKVRNEAATAEIGQRWERVGIFPGGPVIGKFLVADKDILGAQPSTGYKFTPAPPQPTKTYTVAVDSLVESVGFMQTGYSGTFAPMVVSDPDGNPVDCSDTANTLCLTVDHDPGDRMVQYVQVNVGGKTGEWHAVIDAGSSGQGTYSFNALAASAIGVESSTDRLQASTGFMSLRLQLGRPTENGLLTGWFQSPNGAAFGDAFSLFDDGAHGDGRNGDGVFGLPELAVPGRGVGYLWVQGVIDGESITRADPIPFNFQPLRVTFQSEQENNNNQQTDLLVQIENLDGRPLCVDADVSLPAGWGYGWDYDEIGCLYLTAGESQLHTLTLYPDWPDAASGEAATVTVAFLETEEGAISDSASMDLVRRRPPAGIAIDRRVADLTIPPDATTEVPVIVDVFDELGAPVADGQPVQLAASAGSVKAAGVGAATAMTTTVNGRAVFRFMPPLEPGDVALTASTTAPGAEALEDAVTVHVNGYAGQSIALTAAQTDLSGDAPATALQIEVTNGLGQPTAGASVRLGVSDDEGAKGTIAGGEVFTGITDADGRLTAEFKRAPNAQGTVIVRAELTADVGGSARVVDEASVVLMLGEGQPAEIKVFLPLIVR